MAIPDFQSLMLPVLSFLGDNTCYTSSQIVNALADKFKLSEEERCKLYENNPKRIFDDRVAWAKTYLKKANLISYPERGVSQITAEGINVLKTNPEKINMKYLEQFDSYKNFRNIEKQELKEDENQIECVEQQTPDEMIENAKIILMSHLESNLMDKILGKDPTFFEKTVVKLICKMGYGGSEQDIVQSCGKSGDGGIDGVIKQDTLGLDKIYIQAKRYAVDNSVSRPDIQKFLWVVHKKASKGIFITTSYFTKEAVEEAKQGNVVLIDGKKLTKLMVEYNLGVQHRTTIEIKKIDEDFFMDED